MRIFSYESKFSQVMSRIVNGCYLNLLWFVCSIPLFTIGAATTALYTVTLKMVTDEEGDITSQFFGSFKENFKQATQLWLIIAAGAALLAADIYVLNHLRDSATGTLAIILTLTLALVIVACVALFIVFMYVFPLVAYFDNTNFMMLKNSLLIGTHYLFCTICVFVIHVAMAICIISVFTPLIAFGEGICAVISSYLFMPVFRVCAAQAKRLASGNEDA